jgi:adenine-specific DNA-methyltransferase
MKMKKLTDQDPETKSPDLVAENIEQLKTLFPEAFSEDKIDFEVLKQLLGGSVDEREEKYGLNWHGKRRARQIALTPSTGTLRPCPEDSVDWDTTQNLMIEGDNLEVLKLLQKSYAGKVKLIYIDPPYNTGKDFVYPDDFQDNIKNYLMRTGQMESDGRKNASNTEASGRYHTDWLNMMFPRLKLARNLLRNDGAIFISIDDGENARLRKICDEIFGEENFLANLIWQKKYSPQNDEKYFSSSHEHLLVYARSLDDFNIGLLPRTEESDARYKNPDNDPRGPWKSSDLTRQEYRPRDDYDIVSPKTGKKFRPPKGNSWGRPKDVIESLIQDNRIWFGPDGNSVPSLKRFISEVKQGITPQTLWFREEVGDTQEGKKIIKELFGDVSVFETAKPIRLIQQTMTTSSTIGQDIVLDFFAGSGTTGHAVMAQNATDENKRRYILVQLPELTERKDFPTIAEICKERLRRAGKAIRKEYPMFTGDLGFRVFKLDSSNIRAWEPDRDNLAATLAEHAEHLKTDRTEADILFELLLKLGLDLTVPIEQKTIAAKTVHSIGAGTLLVCLATQITAAEVEPLALGIVEWHKQLTPAGETQVVFRDSAFADDVAKTNLTAILQQYGLENVRSL